MVRTQVYLPEELHQELHVLARHAGVSMAELLREGAEKVVKEKKVAKKKTASKFVLPTFSFKKTLPRPLNREAIYEQL